MASGRRTQRSGRQHRHLLIGVIAAATLASCSVTREPVELGGDFISAYVEGTRVDIEVDTCNGNPEITLLEEAADEVRVQVSSRRLGGDSKDCLDGVSIELEEPLGSRPLIDITSGRTLRVDQG